MRTAFLLAASMAAASVGAMIAKPTAKLADDRPAISLEQMIPVRFGEWREQPLGHLQVVNPQTQAVIDRIYSQVLSRVYVNSSGYRVMLSLAYGSDQRRGLQAHKPEVCYPAQGFVVERNEPAAIATAFGSLPVRRLFTRLQSRQEPVTYWFTVGDTAVLGKTEKRLVDLRYGLTGRIPDGMLFRVSSIDGDQRQAFQLQERFITQLLAILPPADRKRLSGLGTSPSL
jgi:EpsI family protein